MTVTRRSPDLEIVGKQVEAYEAKAEVKDDLVGVAGLHFSDGDTGSMESTRVFAALDVSTRGRRRASAPPSRR